MAIKALKETGHSGYRIAKVAVRRRGQTGWQETQQDDSLAEELPVAFSYNGQTHAVMMATPTDLENFALGFSLSEGIIEHTSELYDLNIVDHGERGIELDLRIHGTRLDALKQQRRTMAGPSGCGLCGKDSLDQVMRDLPQVTPRSLPSAEAVETALTQLQSYQPLQQLTGAIHAAAWCDEAGHIQQVREDVGRHNALDKLLGAIYSETLSTDSGFLLLSSRASFELIAKAAQCDLGAMVTVSGASNLAAQQAKRYGIRLVGFARDGRHLVYC
ncbi:formate dehydrogenase family accessory protein FdhD [Saccharospirillum sp. MSK14-1]|uniref:formate dehydrogenase accessory sulfurtransferase FdhD n=1 Tax=Saccharospirillum sp. MSK14-1 TaxID=1897632 RepID=UPI000D3408FB|nr:formate dehydrogenase accessory sulfurtransferase FdhD [Saccharospirillum sp. MSK14-1]PTY38203.1 formate dehydrogenase family accessory protein FdhD [Saccharospirillum sp. MSK14-1]